ncbi:DNA polymerase I [Coleofasciculus sp. FACHB-64]|uniref:DNA polymerase I n=1 Tax=Cyanophyceae TaxID=3028117 RepID=UPI00168202DB|nr:MULTISPECIES: DNA polymerase I [unclassified Coleofasciculus]MBD1841262.1 DNA polymerase I [Coleofasciculus sp. FACHB-501]MBD2047831.1 DNA polymerase I [Coleofasciculus sp. FACHB-64]
MSQSTSASNPSHSAASSSDMRPVFILVDGHSLAFRAYFAFAKGRDGGLKTKTGIPTSVCFGFLKSLLEVIASQQPQAMAIAFDLGLPTFRHEADDTYKADRAETPEDFIVDLKNLHDLLDAFNLPIVTAPGYEADDVLGTLSQKASAAGYRVKIVTGDRDLFQLVNTAQGISVLYLGQTFWQRGSNTGPVEFGPEEVKEKLKGITPEQVVDYKALCGDASDNIPGVKGIGDKTAVKLLTEYGSLDGIYASLDEIKGAVKQKLEAGKEEAYRSQHLARIVLDVPLDVSLEDCPLKGFDNAELEPLLEKLEFRTYLSRIKQLQQAFGGVAEEAKPVESKEELEEIGFDDGDWFFSAADTEAASKAATNATSKISAQIIDTPEKLTELIKQLQSCTDPDKPVAWDTETDALEPRDAQLVGIGCCWGIEPSEVAYIPTGHKTGENLDKTAVLEALRPILESVDYPKSLQNAKFDRLVLRCQGINLAGVVFDTMLASYVLNPENSHNLSDLVLRHLELSISNYTDVVPKGKTIADMDIQTVAYYCGMQVYATFQLVLKLREKLEEVPALERLLREVEQPLEPVLAQMEYVGIRIDPAYLQTLSQELEKDLAGIEQKAYQEAGEKFSLGSPKQLSQILFDKLKLDTKKSRKIQSGYSTDAATLEKLQGDHPLVDAILEYRTLSKLKSTYVDALPLLIRPDTQRVHTNFNQTGTTTGRLSSSNPNLQNIPIRTAFSRRIRKGFVPETGWLLVAADYSQIELRILAHLSQEPVLIEAYQQNEDIHSVTARLLLEKDTVTSEERRLGKIINFGVIYGMGAQRFAREAGVKATEGRLFIDRFNERYRKVFEYLERVKREAIAHGYVQTILGRRRYFNFEGGSLRKLQGSNPDEINLDKLRNLGQADAGSLRAAANAPIQGSSADIIKIAMDKLHKVLQNYQARLLLQVHDELVLEVPPSEWEELQPQIRSTMENAVSLSVPLKVDVRAGQNWMETK